VATIPSIGRGRQADSHRQGDELSSHTLPERLRDELFIVLKEREFIYQVHNIDNTRQLLQWQAASGGISPS